MPRSQYDAIIPNIGGTNFTGYYKQGINLKLSDGGTVINIWKPERCPYNLNNEEVYKDSIIEFSGNSKNKFTYKDMQRVTQAIEIAIDYLNKENENLIDREKDSTYECIKISLPEKKKTSAIKYSELEIGGVYLDDKKRKWIFLGEGKLEKNEEQRNRSNDGYDFSKYIYMEYPEDGIELLDENLFKITHAFPHPDTYASKKRFFEKVDQLKVVSGIPVLIDCGGFNIYKASHGVKPKTYHEIMQEKNERRI